MLETNTAAEMAQRQKKRGAPAKTMAYEAMVVTRPKKFSA
jgi:hypothetical protein